MSSRGNLHPWFVVGIGVLLFAVLPLVRKVTGSPSRVDPIEGVWVGQIHFFEDHPIEWTGIPGPHREGIFTMTLIPHHNMPAYYDGDGTIAVAGDSTARELRAFNFVRDAQGAFHLEFNFGRGPGDLSGQSDSLIGHLQNNLLQFYAGDQAHPTMSLELHRGSADEFQQLVAAQAASASHPTHAVKR